MNPLIRAALAIDLLINCAEQAFPWLNELAPMGGTSFLQLSTLLIFAVAVSELREVIAQPRGAVRPAAEKQDGKDSIGSGRD